MMCGKRYIPHKRYQLFCSDECESKDLQTQRQIDEKLYNITCSQCGQQFRKAAHFNRSRTCERCSKENKKETKVYDNSKISKKKSGLPLEELIRRKEYKRVMDEKWATRCMRGIKWG
ncbi:MAG: hypothetical protein WC679_13200 [Bacteroidales bacterium]|jgi:hypothetical protein